ncbi:hypothetical protein BYT27DRAFT_7197529, partial [Phlegmacium glaucopus]
MERLDGTFRLTENQVQANNDCEAAPKDPSHRSPARLQHYQDQEPRVRGILNGL